MNRLLSLIWSRKRLPCKPNKDLRLWREADEKKKEVNGLGD
jgi:hypothetical protein